MPKTPTKNHPCPIHQDKRFSNQLLKKYGKTAINASGTAQRGRGFHTPDTCQIAI